MIWTTIGIAITMLMCLATIMYNNKLAKKVDRLESNDHDRWCREQDAAAKEERAKAEIKEKLLESSHKSINKLLSENKYLKDCIERHIDPKNIVYGGHILTRDEFVARKVKGKTVITITKP